MQRFVRVIVALAALCFAAGWFAPHASAQHRTKDTQPQRAIVAFWNVENLHDTIRSPFYDDSDFTPGGRYRWNTDRYIRKNRNTAHVIDDLGADIIALAEVENEAVLRDLVAALRDDYNYIHRTSGDTRGMDLALLYRGDRFFPEKVRLLPSSSSREFLLVGGEFMGEDVNLLVAHLPSQANSREYRARAIGKLAATADSLLTNDGGRKLIVMGDFNADPASKPFRKAFGRPSGGFHTTPLLYGAIPHPAKGGFGSYAYGRKWLLYDNILLSSGFLYSEGLRYEAGSVFARDYMIAGAADSSLVQGRAGYPLRTITSGTYTGGFSDHLPVFVILAKLQ